VGRRPSPYPTELELAVLKVLWREGPLSVRALRDTLATGPRPRDLAHTTVITVLTILAAKGYVRREKVGNAHVYHPLVPEAQVSGRMLQDLVDRVFDGSAKALMLQLLQTADLDADELRELRRLLGRKAQE
jgi:BlaI family transcriptional regulator, penicillinase repressor